MSRLALRLLALLTLGLLLPGAATAAPEKKVPAAPAAAAAPLFADPDQLLAADPSAAQELTTKLTAFAQATGLKIHLHFRAKFQPLTPGQRPGNVTAGIGRELHLTDNEILAVYFADIDKWGLWIGGHHVNHFVGRPGTVRALTKDGSFHHAKLVFTTAAQTRGVELANAAAQNSQLSDAQKIHFLGSAMADAFIAKFSPAPTPAATP